MYMMDNPLITVVIPIYNVEKYLDRCINSLVNQTYRNLEIILVDDGSPDNCPAMCDGWAERDHRIRVIHKKNAGLGMARNTGIEAATGDYICFFDSDDYVDRETIVRAYGAIAANGAEIAVYGLTRVNSLGDPVGQKVPVPEKHCYRGEEVRTVFLPDLIDSAHVSARNRNLCLSAWSALYSMELVRRTNWRFVSEREIISEDSYSLIWLYRYADSVVILPEPLYFYCENGNSLTQTYRPDRFRRTRHFYDACTEMAVRIGHGPEIITHIGGLFIGFTVAAMKQIVTADLPRKQRRTLIAEIVEDTAVQQVLHDPACRYSSRLRNILLWSMGRKWHAGAYALVWLQTIREQGQKQSGQRRSQENTNE